MIIDDIGWFTFGLCTKWIAYPQCIFDSCGFSTERGLSGAFLSILLSYLKTQTSQVLPRASDNPKTCKNECRRDLLNRFYSRRRLSSDHTLRMVIFSFLLWKFIKTTPTTVLRLWPKVDGPVACREPSSVGSIHDGKILIENIKCPQSWGSYELIRFPSVGPNQDDLDRSEDFALPVESPTDFQLFVYLDIRW